MRTIHTKIPQNSKIRRRLFPIFSRYGGWINGLLSSPIWIPLGRMSYAVYLIHLWQLIGYFGSLHDPRQFDFNQLWHEFLSNLVVVFFFAFWVRSRLQLSLAAPPLPFPPPRPSTLFFFSRKVGEGGLLAQAVALTTCERPLFSTRACAAFVSTLPGLSICCFSCSCSRHVCSLNSLLER